MESIPKRPLGAFFGTVLIGGSNFLAVKFSNQELKPLFGAAVRFLAAGLLFLLIARLAQKALPRGRAFGGAVIYGLLSFGLSYAFLYYAITGLEAGTASVIVAMIPLITLVLAVLHRQERFSLRGLVGGVLAIGGIAVISSRSLGGDLELRFVLASLAGVITSAESSVIIKGFPKADPVTTNAVGMLAGSALLFAGSWVFDESWTVPSQTETWLALAWLVLAGSIGLFYLFVHMIIRWTASASSYAITLMPLVVITMGAFLLGEEVTAQVLAGAALVISGVWVGALSKRTANP